MKHEWHPIEEEDETPAPLMCSACFACTCCSNPDQRNGECPGEPLDLDFDT